MKKLLTFFLLLVLSLSLVACADNKKEVKETSKKEEKKEEPKKEMPKKTEPRPDEKGLLDRIIGGWESDRKDGSYYVFKEDGTFFWYKSSKNLDDNYYTGKYTVLYGNDAVKDLEINPAGIKKMTEETNGKVNLFSVYSIKMSPNKLLSAGVDKTKTLKEGYFIKLMFIYIDEKKAQGYNYNYEDKYNFHKNDVYKNK